MMNRIWSLLNAGLTRGIFVSLSFLVVWTFLIPVGTVTAAPLNKIVSLQVSSDSGKILVNVETEQPVGYRYTVYDSVDPTRIVVDFPGMDISSVEAPVVDEAGVVKEVKLSSFDLTSGKLGRLEVIVDEILPYDIQLDGTLFSMSIETTDAGGKEQSVKAESTDVRDLENDDVEAGTMEELKSDSTAQNATLISDVSIQPSSVLLNANGHVEIFKYFKLGAPPRLVVDVYGVKPKFEERKFDLSAGFSLLRIGTYSDKIRFVLDASNDLPEYVVKNDANGVLIAWGKDSETLVDTPLVKSSSESPVDVEAVEFDLENGESLVRITLSGKASIIEPTLKDGIVGFGIRNATIKRSLRRAVDASSFPSSIRLVTPYTVLVGDSQDVRFAVELKGPSDYELVRNNNVVTLKVANGPFAESEPPVSDEIAVDIPAHQAADSIENETVETMSATDGVATNSSEMSGADSGGSAGAVLDSSPGEDAESVQDEYGYTGQRISLVFDNAEIRNILQLIAEVSNLNILAGDGVDGTITLRLIDVPWDQALDLILDTKDLGMIRSGNVARILPKDSIRAMDEAKFTADRTREKLEDLEKAVITVSYTDLENISGPAREFLTDRGSITEDARNKKLIIKDIPKVIEEIRDLVTELDTPEKQVMIEARIVEVSTSSSLDLGVNWGVSYSDDATHIPGGTQNSSGAAGLGGAFTLTPGVVEFGGSAGIGSEFSWGRIGTDTTVLDLRLSALETSGEGQVVSNPRIMTLNGEQARISQGTQIPYQTTSDGEVTTEMVEASLSLEVTPIINPDNSVILDVTATNSTPGANVKTGAGDEAPAIDKKEAITKMLVKDGETMVIGGIYVEKEDSSESGVPLLMHIPFLGNLFKSTSKIQSRAELMVFITPRIIE